MDCLYPANDHLRHDFDAQVIPAGQTIDVTFSFVPNTSKKYHEVVNFEINGLSQQHVDFYGQGTELKVEVADPRNKVVKLGALRVGQTLKKQVPIVNNSPAPITFRVGFTPSNTLLNDRGIFRFLPYNENVSLAPRGGTAKLDILFTPKTRIPHFSEEVGVLHCVLT